MRNNKYLLFIGLLVVLSSLLSIYFYQRNATAMRVQAEYFFVRTLTSELQKKVVILKLPHFASRPSSDTIPLTLRITTVEGVKIYKVDAEKSRKNISHNPMERSLHSIVWEENPLSLDTLNQLWADTLRGLKIYAITTMRVSITTLHDKTLTSASTGDNRHVAYSSRFVSYVGNRCEIEVAGLLKHSWWAVCLYHWSPFLWILVGVVFILFLSRSFYRLTHRPAKMEIIKEEVIREVIVEKEVICEVIKEVPVSIFVKELDDVKLKLYQLQPGLIFDARKQVLVLNGVDKDLASQSCVILNIFLDAPDYTLTDTEIIEKVWGKRDASMKDFTAACARLRISLAKVGFSVLFKRVERDQYRMVIC